MTNRSGLTFADVLILVAIVLLLAALAIPKFVEPQDYGNEEDETAEVTNTNAAASSATGEASTNAIPPVESLSE
ncbi:MAG: hypothetical protein WCO77_03060 [bacterium]